jgi:Flp pilus assembly protein TadB
MNLIKDKFGWRARLLFVLLAVIVAASLGRDNWRTLLTPQIVIIASAAFLLSLVWGFLDNRRRRRNSN